MDRWDIEFGLDTNKTQRIGEKSYFSRYSSMKGVQEAQIVLRLYLTILQDFVHLDISVTRPTHPVLTNEDNS
ncbi:Uncharacterized protein HZ326_27927 [Fusarium oxysporum f. sp. albedinis]|nr:Uncharacterized protein HZ326_27927 [Fusarium oxysporum f. sp. albedinis]